MSMSSYAAAQPARPDSLHFALGLLLGFGISLSLAWLWGHALIEALLPLTRAPLLWLDGRFEILHLGVERNLQDTVIRLRVNATQMIVVGSQTAWPEAGQWLEVTTTLGAMLQPLVIAVGLAAAWPGKFATRLLRIAIAMMLGMAFLLIDIPVTLHAYVWDMYIYAFDPSYFSPLLIWHEFMHAGGRLGLGVLIGIASATLGSRLVHRIALAASQSPSMAKR